MFDEEVYDPVVEELDSISKQMAEIQRLLEQQVKIEISNNMLLRKILKRQFSEHFECNLQGVIVENYKEKNMLLINGSIETCKKVAKKIAESTNKRFIVATATSSRELIAALFDAQDGDIIFYDATTPFFDQETLEILLKSIKREEVELVVGKGETMRKIVLDLPTVYFVVYADMIELIPESLKEVLEQV